MICNATESAWQVSCKNKTPQTWATARFVYAVLIPYVSFFACFIQRYSSHWKMIENRRPGVAWPCLACSAGVVYEIPSPPPSPPSWLKSLVLLVFLVFLMVLLVFYWFVIGFIGFLGFYWFFIGFYWFYWFFRVSIGARQRQPGKPGKGQAGQVFILMWN